MNPVFLALAGFTLWMAGFSLRFGAKTFVWSLINFLCFLCFLYLAFQG